LIARLRYGRQTILRDPLILPVYVPSLIFAFCQGLLAPVLPLYAVDFGVSYGLVGLVLAGEPLGRLLSDVPLGIFLRRLGQKRAMLIGVALVALSTIGLFWAPSIIQAFVFQLMMGFGVALFSIARHAYLAETIIITSRGRAIALFGGVNRIGKFSGPAVGGLIAAAYGLRMPFLVFAGACTIVFIVLLIFVRKKKVADDTLLPTANLPGNHLLVTLKHNYGVLLTAGSGQIFAQMIRAGREVIIPLYAADVLGLDVKSIGLIISVAAAIDMSLFYPAGLLMDRLGRKFAIVPSFLLQGLGMALVPFTGGFGSLLAAAGLIGFGNGLGSGTMMTLAADLAPAETRGELLGLWRLIGDAGFSGGPLVVGSVAGWVTLQTAAQVMAGAGFMAVLVFVLLVPETLKKQSRIIKMS